MKKFAILAAAAALAVPCLAFAEQQTWKISGDVGGLQFTLTCTLQVDDGKLAGPCISSLDPKPVTTTGTYTASGASEFSYDVTYQDMPIHVVYKGQQQADGSVNGTVDASGNAGTFKAVQQK